MGGRNGPSRIRLCRGHIVRDTGIDIYVPVKESIDIEDHSEEVSKITNNIRKNEMKMKE